MNVLFLTISKINSLEDRGGYTDLLREFYKEGHNVYVVSPVERRENKKTNLLKEKKGEILNVQTLNIQKTNVVEKGIGTLVIEYQFLSAIKKYFPSVKFDLIIYSTPPITFSKVISFIKKRDNAYSYLLLKDIFPQNAIDMKMLREQGLLHKMFLKKEQKLYELSDAIGCMSEANKNYVLAHNFGINPNKVEVNPNSIEPVQSNQTIEEKITIKKKYGLPLDKMIFVYGGNLGKPQGIDFLLETIESNTNQKVFFLVVGSGTEYNRIEKWFGQKQLKNTLLMSGLPKNDYDLLLNVCDVGMIFLDKDFTIPNFPSRLLSYLEIKIPVIAATDPNTDIGDILEKNNCGYKVLAGDILNMHKVIDEICTDVDKYNQMSKNAWDLLQKEYTSELSFNIIKNRLKYV
jgi:glycosyltransferase involved in cell wall biosynthesis